MMHTRLPDPFEPLRCLRQPEDSAETDGTAVQPVLLRRREYALPAELLTRADSYDVEPLCAAVRTALRRVVVQRALLSPCGFDQRWERALWVCNEQTYKLWRGLWHATLLCEVERREALGRALGDGNLDQAAADQAALRVAKAMLLGDLLELGAAARAALPGGEWEPFQLGRLIEDGDGGALGPSLSGPPPSPPLDVLPRPQLQ